jgi:hypothetical protein
MSLITHTTRNLGWVCTLPGCRDCGSGYPSERVATVAERTHLRRRHRIEPKGPGQ